MLLVFVDLTPPSFSQMVQGVFHKLEEGKYTESLNLYLTFRFPGLCRRMSSQSVRLFRCYQTQVVCLGCFQGLKSIEYVFHPLHCVIKANTVNTVFLRV